MDWKACDTPVLVRRAGQLFEQYANSTAGTALPMYLGELSEITVALTWVLEGGAITTQDYKQIFDGFFEYFAKHPELDKKAIELTVRNQSHKQLIFFFAKRGNGERHFFHNRDDSLQLDSFEYMDRPLDFEDALEVLDRAKDELNTRKSRQRLPSDYQLSIDLDDTNLRIRFDEYGASKVTVEQLYSVIESISSGMRLTSSGQVFSIYGYFKTNQIVGFLQLADPRWSDSSSPVSPDEFGATNVTNSSVESTALHGYNTSSGIITTY